MVDGQTTENCYIFSSACEPNSSSGLKCFISTGQEINNSICAVTRRANS